MIKLSNFVNPLNHNNSSEYDVIDFDNPKGWNWKEVDHLLDMGFEMEGNTRLKLTDKKDLDNTLSVIIYKSRPEGNYVMIINDRKHVFSSMNKLLEFIDSRDIAD